MNVLVLNPGTEQTKNVIRDLIYGCWCKGKRIGGMKSPPLNLLYVATILKENGHKVKFIDALSDGTPFKKIVPIVKQTDVIIILTSTMSFTEDAQTVADCKKINPNIISIAFGSHPTFMSKQTLEGGFDYAVRKEAEFIIRDLVNSLDHKTRWKKVKGISYMSGKKGTSRYKLIENPDYGFPDLNDLPIPDRKLLPKDVDYFNPLVKKVPYTTMITSRGCPALCTFCTVPTFFGNKIRARSEELVLEEFEIIKKLGYKEVWLRDETFTVYKKRNMSICKEMIKRDLNLSWLCNARVGTIDKPQMKLMKKAGCHMVKFGVESGVQRILDNVKKGVKVQNTIRTFRWAHEVKMDTHAHMMLGMPGETKSTINRSIRFAKKIDPTTVSFGICTPYAGTPLFNEVLDKHPEIEDGSSCDLSKLHTQSFYNTQFTDLTEEELNASVRKAYRAFYFRPGYLFKWLGRVNNLDELRRVTMAGSQVFSFSVEKD